MICLIDSYIFDVKETDAIAHDLRFDWADRKRLGNNPMRQAVGKWDEEIAIDGRLLVRSVKALEAFEELAKAKEPVRLTFGTGESFMVVITALSKRKKEFLKDGKFLVQEYTVALKRYFE